MNEINEIPMRGIDGGNLLGSLAALGVLRKLAEQTDVEETRLRWVWSGNWTPVVINAQISSQVKRAGGMLDASVMRGSHCPIRRGHW